MRYKNRKTTNNSVNDSLKDEVILESKRRSAGASDRARSHRIGGYVDLGADRARPPAVEGQLLRQLAGLDVTDSAQVELTDFVKIEIELPLWQVLGLARDGDVNEQLVGLLGEVLNGEESNAVYMARLNAMILKAASD